jgi:hypothetical protein
MQCEESLWAMVNAPSALGLPSLGANHKPLAFAVIVRRTILMSRPSKAKRDKAKAKAAQRALAAMDQANAINPGKVRSVVSSYAMHAHLSAAPSFSYAPNRYKTGSGKSIDQSHKPDQMLKLTREYPAEHGRSNLLPKPIRTYPGRKGT